jgi:L-iditol 2-dehydrogenase
LDKTTMKAAVWFGKGDIRIEERPLPDPAEDEAVIAVSYTGICGSDISGIEGSPLAPPPPLIFGHEFSGVVETLGSHVKGFQKGDRVVAHPTATCGECYNCREGEENFCKNLYFPMLSGAGGSFAEYILVKARQLYHLPPEVHLKEAALVEPAAIALHCMDRAEMKPGARVLIYGGGSIGQLILQMARLSGAGWVVLSEPVASKRTLAQDLGADRVVDPGSEDLAKIVQEATCGLGVDLCIEAAGVPGLIEQGLTLLRERGRLIPLGTPPIGSTITLDPMLIFFRELEIRGSFFSPYSFQRTIQLLPRLNLHSLITHCFDLSEIDQAVETLKTGKGIKVLLKP